MCLFAASASVFGWPDVYNTKAGDISAQPFSLAARTALSGPVNTIRPAAAERAGEVPTNWLLAAVSAAANGLFVLFCRCIIFYFIAALFLFTIILWRQKKDGKKRVFSFIINTV